MKKIIVIMTFLIIILGTDTIYGAETNEVLSSQEEAYGISSFVQDAEKYTEDVFEDVNIHDLYKDALTGKINTKGLLSGIFKILGSEVTQTIRSLGFILIIIIIHSIIKSISEGMGNEEIGEITYYVQYILIITLIMTNFSDTIVLIKDTINSLVGFINSLLPILISLMITTREFGFGICRTATSFTNYYFYREFYNTSTIASYINPEQLLE